VNSLLLSRALKACSDENVLSTVLDGLSSSMVLPDPDLLPVLARIAGRKPFYRPALALISRMENAGARLALGYRALFETRACSKFAQWLRAEGAAYPGLQDLANLAREFSPSPVFPVRQLILCCGVSYACDNFEWLAGYFPDEKSALEELLDLTEKALEGIVISHSELEDINSGLARMSSLVSTFEDEGGLSARMRSCLEELERRGLDP
jgi:hypothetical protein